MRTYYTVLGVEKTADAATLRNVYRKLALQYHPDRHPGDTDAEARFKEVSEAYAVLKDEEKRARYDRLLSAAPPRPPAAASTPRQQYRRPRQAFNTASKHYAFNWQPLIRLVFWAAVAIASVEAVSRQSKVDQIEKARPVPAQVAALAP